MPFSEALRDYLLTHKPDNEKNKIGQIMRDHLAWILNCPDFSNRQRNTASMIAACKTESMGYYAEYCPKCDKVIAIHYRSCKNHCCPSCQTTSQMRWSMLRQAEIIPYIPYFHVVLTLPHELNSLILANRKELLGLLFRASSDSVIQLSLDPRFLGAKPGIISVIHSWSQELSTHMHVHLIISGGGLDKNGVFIRLKDGWEKRTGEAENLASKEEVSSAMQESIGAALQAEDLAIVNGEEGQPIRLQPVVSQHEKRVPFFLPERALTKLFRGKYLAGLSSLYKNGKLRLPGDLDYLNNPYEWSAFGQKLGEMSWVGHVVRTFQGNGNAIEYLARYTFRTAISNSRILEYDGNHVTISCRNNSDYHKKRIVKMNVYEFIRRYLTHVPPKSFSRIRYSGFLSNSCKTKNLKSILEQVSNMEYRPAKTKESVNSAIIETLHSLGFHDDCPCCGTKLSIIGIGINLPKGRRRASPAA